MEKGSCCFIYGGDSNFRYFYPQKSFESNSHMQFVMICYQVFYFYLITSKLGRRYALTSIGCTIFLFSSTYLKFADPS